MRTAQHRRLFAAVCLGGLGVATVAQASDTSVPTDDTTAASGTAAAGDCGEPGDAGEIDVFLIPSPSATSIQSFIPDFEAATCIAVNVSETPYGEAHQKQLLAYQQGDGQYDVAQFDNTFLAAVRRRRGDDAARRLSGGERRVQHRRLRPRASRTTASTEATRWV